MEHLGFFLVVSFVLLAIIAGLILLCFRYLGAYNFMVSLSLNEMGSFFRDTGKVSLAIIKARELQIRKSFEHVISGAINGGPHRHSLGFYIIDIERLQNKKRNFLMKIFVEEFVKFPPADLAIFTARILHLLETEKDHAYSSKKTIDFVAYNVTRNFYDSDLFLEKLLERKKEYMELEDLDPDTKVLLMASYIEFERRLK